MLIEPSNQNGKAELISGYKHDYNRNKAIDGKAKTVSIEIINVKGIQNENIKYNYYYEVEFCNKRFCYSEHSNFDYKLIIVIKEDKKTKMNMYIRKKKEKIDISKADEYIAMQKKTKKKKAYIKEFK
ncbi:29292_t:CDS:2, partial [Gigaspora margarita]